MTVAIDYAKETSPAPPGVAPARWARLEAFLGAMTPAAAGKLFATLEAARLKGADDGLPTAAMLASLRVRLGADRDFFPARPLTAQRLFFTPFEDFFVTHRSGRKRRARIARTTLAPLWRLITEDAALIEARANAVALDGAIARGEADLGALAQALYGSAALGLSRLVAHAERDQGFRADLGARLAAGGGPQAGAAALLDLAEINLMLPAHRHFSAARASFPKPVAALSEEQLFEARALYARACAEASDAAPYLLLLIAARMEAPWRALPLVHHLAGVQDETLPHAREDAELLLDALFDDLESCARQLERDADDDLNVQDAGGSLDYFADFAAGLIAEAKSAGDAVTVSRAEACRDIAAAALMRFCEQALAAIRKTQPVRHAGGSSRLMALRPDIERPLEPGAEARAGAAAKFLASAGGLAQRLGRPDAVASLVADACAESRRYAGDLVVEIRAGEGADRISARRRMEMALGVAEPLIPPAELALLRERAAAAAVSA
jgi:hypothetical protein